MAYNSAYTGKQVDEGVRRALTIPSTGLPSGQFPYYIEAYIENYDSDTSLDVSFGIDNGDLIDRYLNNQQVIAQFTGADGHGFIGQFMLMGYDSSTATASWVGTLTDGSTSDPVIRLYIITCPEVGAGNNAYGTAKAFDSLAFKSLVEKTDLSTEVLTLLNKQPKQYTGTLLATGWTEDTYGYQKQTITISGLKASYDVDPQWDVVLSGTDPDADAALLEGFALIHNYKTGANSLTAQCIGDAPTVNIPVKVVVFG